MIYLASPYSHPDPWMRRIRFETVCRCAAELIRQGNVVFCPIAHSHPIELYGGIEGTWEVWQEQDIPFLDNCDEMYVCCTPGWETSEGVQAEIAHWERNKLTPITYVGANGVPLKMSTR